MFDTGCGARPGTWYTWTQWETWFLAHKEPGPQQVWLGLPHCTYNENDEGWIVNSHLWKIFTNNENDDYSTKNTMTITSPWMLKGGCFMTMTDQSQRTSNNNSYVHWDKSFPLQVEVSSPTCRFFSGDRLIHTMDGMDSLCNAVSSGWTTKLSLEFFEVTVIRKIYNTNDSKACVIAHLPK